MPGDPSHIVFVDFDVVARVWVGADIGRIDYGARCTPTTRLDVVGAVVFHTRSIVSDRSIPLGGAKAILVGCFLDVVSYRVIDSDDFESTPSCNRDRWLVEKTAGLETLVPTCDTVTMGKTGPPVYHDYDEQREAVVLFDGVPPVDDAHPDEADD